MLTLCRSDHSTIGHHTIVRPKESSQTPSNTILSFTEHLTPSKHHTPTKHLQSNTTMKFPVASLFASLSPYLPQPHAYHLNRAHPRLSLICLHEATSTLAWAVHPTLLVPTSVQFATSTISPTTTGTKPWSGSPPTNACYLAFSGEQNVRNDISLSIPISSHERGWITSLQMGHGSRLTFSYRIVGKEVRMGNTSRERGNVFCATVPSLRGYVCVVEFKCKDIGALAEDSTNTTF